VDRGPSESRREQLADVTATNLRGGPLPTSIQKAPEPWSSIDPDRLYTYEEIAAMCGVSPRRVRRWVEEGKLGWTPLPGGRGRRIAGWQWIDYVRAHAVAADAR
jgi:excisionase family DNA binding protein